MKLLYPCCRAGLTADDRAFIAAVLGKHGQSTAVEQLCADADSLDLLLDDRALLQALRTRTGCLRASPRLYFYILIRRALHDAGMDDRALADYVATIFAEFARSRNLWPAHVDTQFEYATDVLVAEQRAEGGERFVLLQHGGNFMLFLTSLFAARIQHRRERRAAPGMAYYEAHGRACYRRAGRHELAARAGLRDVLHQLADAFPQVRCAVQDMAARETFAGRAIPDTMDADTSSAE